MSALTRSFRADPRPERAALLVVDVQRDFCDPSVSRFDMDQDVVDAVKRAATVAAGLADAARDLGVHVVWIRLERRSDNMWPASDWLFDRSEDGWAPCLAGTAGADWFVVEPGDEDTIVTKSRHSAFHGTDLAERLRARGVATVAVCGITTDCCVESTVRDAYQADLPPLVVADACAAHDPARHENALEIMATHVARVATSAELMRHWRSAAAGSTDDLLPGFMLTPTP